MHACVTREHAQFSLSRVRHAAMGFQRREQHLPLVLLLPSLLLPGCVDSAPGASDLRRRPAGESSELHIAVKAGDRAEVERLLGNGADIEAKPFAMYSAPPLHFAALAGDLDLVGLLLDNGAAVDSKELRHGSTALHVAASRGHIEIVRHLLQRGAEVNMRNKERGHTPLHEAARGGKSQHATESF